MSYIVGIVLHVALFGTPGAGSATQQATADSVVAEVQKFYASVDQVTAQFRQTVTLATYNTTKNSDGKVYIQKPGKMRWDYLEKKGKDVQFKKSFISNGTVLYLVEHDNMQVTKKNLSQDLMPVTVSFLYGKGDLKSEFNAALDTSGTYGGKGDIVLKLTPKKPSAQYKYLTLVVDPKDGHVRESIIVDASNNVNDFKFYSPDFKSPIEDKYFQFNPASLKNYRVIDADQQQGSGAAPPPAPPPPASIAPKK
jgi:outer membrane lipoprotein carrier protein